MYDNYCNTKVFFVCIKEDSLEELSCFDVFHKKVEGKLDMKKRTIHLYEIAIKMFCTTRIPVVLMILHSFLLRAFILTLGYKNCIFDQKKERKKDRQFF